MTFFNRLFLSIFLFLFIGTTFVQSQESKIEFLPDERIFPQLTLDPLECQIYGGIHRLYEKGTDAFGVYTPVNLGFSKAMLRKGLENGKFELGLEVAAYTQFDIHEVEEGVLLGGLLNIDYKASSYLAYVQNKQVFKFRIFHISSHLGDDYLIRNEITTRNDQTVNYEQIDIMYMYQSKFGWIYAGLAEVFTPNAYRERFSFQLGYQGLYRLKESNFALVSGIDIKSYQQNDFYPNTRIGFGISYLKQNIPKIQILLEYYNGHLPYSTLEYRQVQWIGISSVLQLW